MAKDLDLVQDDTAEKPDTSIRGSIKAALEQSRESDDESKGAGRIAEIDGDDAAQKASARSQSERDGDDKPAAKVEKSADKSSEKGPEKSVSRLPVEKGDDKEIPAKSDSEPKIRPPVGWTREGKAAWETLPPDVQKSVLKREEEFSNGIKQYADKAKAYEEYDQVIAPYRQQIQSYGVTPVQTVGKLLEWMHMLGNPNPQMKHMAFQTLAQSFGFDVANLGPRQQNAGQAEDNQNGQAQFDPSLIDQMVQQRIQPFQQQFQSFQQQQEQQAQEQARNAVAEWAKDKPYYEQVRVTMHNLISSGEVPLKNGTLDLDTAYNKAIRLNEDVWAQTQEDAQQKALQEAQERASRDAAEKAAKLRKAQNIGVGIRPTAPMIRPGAIQAKPNGDARKMTVRESLRMSLQQMRDGE